MRAASGRRAGRLKLTMSSKFEAASDRKDEAMAGQTGAKRVAKLERMMVEFDI